jgi:hypothetical protein
VVAEKQVFVLDGQSSSGRRLGMSCRLRHLGFDPQLPLDYQIHGFGRWSCVSAVYYQRVGSKGLALVRFLVIKKILLSVSTSARTKFKCLKIHTVGLCF